MKVADFDFELPEELVAQAPAEPRDAARLFVHDVASATSAHAHVRDLPRFLRAGDLLVANDTRVRPARLCGRRASGGAVELLVLGAVPGASSPLWRAWAKPAGKLREGEELDLEDGRLVARAVRRPLADDGAPGAEWHVAIRASRADDPRALEELLEAHGRMPLPPYIRRSRGDDTQRDADRERYQTVFARNAGAVAAPTAGLHFTPRLLAELDAAGVERATITLHVGLGTFQPIAVDDLDRHRMHSEEYAIPPATSEAIARARARGGRIVAVGTTSVRALESAVDAQGRVPARTGSTDIFIAPGHAFRAVDVLMTNFHLPKSTLLVLVSAFVGRERALALYAEAVERRYRFFSYGDAMLLIRRT